MGEGVYHLAGSVHCFDDVVEQAGCPTVESFLALLDFNLDEVDLFGSRVVLVLFHDVLLDDFEALQFRCPVVAAVQGLSAGLYKLC